MSSSTRLRHRSHPLRGAGHPGAGDRSRRGCRADRRGAGRGRPAGARSDAAHAGGARTRSARCSAVPGAIVGAGTVLDPGAARRRARAPARSSWSAPASPTRSPRRPPTPDSPFLPGVATASEIMRARELGFSRLKFFPAEAAGGAAGAEGAERGVRRDPLLPDRRHHRRATHDRGSIFPPSPASAEAGSRRRAKRSISTRFAAAPRPPPPSAAADSVGDARTPGCL